MIVIDRKAERMLELAWLVTFLAELGHEQAIITREYLHSIVFAVGCQQKTSMMVERQDERAEELAIGIAWLLGADRERDSSITIKNIVSQHLHSGAHSPKRPPGQINETILETSRDKQASNEQQEPIDEGTKNSTSLTNHSLPHTILFLIIILMILDACTCLPINQPKDHGRSLCR